MQADLFTAPAWRDALAALRDQGLLRALPQLDDLDAPLRHGIVRLAAHQYRERDEGAAVLPAAVIALWRPYRMVRL